MRYSGMCVLVLGLVTGAVRTDGPGWSMDDPQKTIPDSPLTGKIFGRDLGEYDATFSDFAISIRSKAKVNGWSASEMIIFAGEKERGETITVTPKSDGMFPHIHMRTAIEGRNSPGLLMYTEMYSMRLETEKVGDGKLKCAIHLSLPDYKKTTLVGRFTAHKQ